MQITINVPDKLIERSQDKWGDLSQKILEKLVVEAFLEGLIDFDEFKEILPFKDEIAFKAFLSANIPLHTSGLLNLYGACPELEIVEDELKISDDMDDDLIGVFDE